MQRRIDADYYDEMTQRYPLALKYFDDWYWKKQKNINDDYVISISTDYPTTYYEFYELPIELQRMYYDIFLQEHDYVYPYDVWGAWTSYMVYHLEPKLQDE